MGRLRRSSGQAGQGISGIRGEVAGFGFYWRFRIRLLKSKGSEVYGKSVGCRVNTTHSM